MHTVRMKLAKWRIVGTGITYQVTGDAGTYKNITRITNHHLRTVQRHTFPMRRRWTFIRFFLYGFFGSAEEAHRYVVSADRVLSVAAWLFFCFGPSRAKDSFSACRRVFALISNSAAHIRVYIAR